MWVVIDANFQAKPSFIFDIKRIVSHSLDFESFACVYKQLLTIEFSNTLYLGAFITYIHYKYHDTRTTLFERLQKLT